MFIIPAIDLKDGQCVRLRQGRKEDVTVYSGDPAATAMRWEACGAEVLHIVDLDGAFTGSQKNTAGILQIRKHVRMIMEVGGGIRDIATVDRLISAGIDRVIVGTSAVEDSGFLVEACSRFPGRVLVGIDARDGKVAVRGWQETSSVDSVEFAKRVEKVGVSGIIYTDISRDGMLSGPNIPALREMVGTASVPVIASGGIATPKDVADLLTIPGLWGAITGKAIYSGSLDLREAVRMSKEAGGDE